MFQLMPFLVKQVTGIEQIHFFTRDLVPCTGIAELDRVTEIFSALAVTEEVLRLAAQFWADLKIGLGRGGTDNLRLDADVIVAAETRMFAQDEIWQSRSRQITSATSCRSSMAGTSSGQMIGGTFIRKSVLDGRRNTVQTAELRCRG